MPAAVAVAIVLVLVLGGYLLYGMLSSAGPPEKPKIQQISLVQPPPPPPPPPKLEEPPPEQQVDEVETPEEDVEDLAESDEVPPGEELGLDAEGVAGSDGFGLKAKKGGRGLLSGSGAYTHYSGLLKNEIQRVIESREEARSNRYSVIVRIWIDGDGSIDRSELVTSSGDPSTDAAIRAALAEGVRVSEAPPPDMPQPVKLRISTRI
jgi:TonB family protein